MSSSFQDINDLVFNNLVIANWFTDNLVNTDYFKMFLVLLERSS